MALIKCPECKKKVSDQCENCPNCGYPIKANIAKTNTAESEATITSEVIKSEEKKPEKVKKPINKKLLIAIIAVASVILIVGGIVGYNALLPRINATRDFKAAIAIVQEKNAQLDAAIKESEDLILKKQPLLDESLTPALEMAISDAKAVKESNFKTPGSVDEIITRTEELKKTDYTAALKNLSEKHEAVVVNAKRYQLVNHPTEAYIIQCLKTIPEIVNISAVTEDNDPNGNLNKPGGYTATVYFAHEKINLDKSIYGETLIEQGTDAGGGIEVYACVEDAVKRRDYLATFDGGIFANGTHTVIGTVLVRTSNELTATQQKDLEAKLIAALTYLPEIDKNDSESSKPDDTTTPPTTAPDTTPPTTNTTEPDDEKENDPPVTVQPVDRKQAAVAEAIKQANRWFPIDRHFIEYILVNPSLEEGFEPYTEEEAAYAIANADIDWKKHALYNAIEALEANPGIDFSQQDVRDFVQDSGGYCGCAGYTDDELQYAVDNCGIDWDKLENTPPNNRDEAAIEEARWMAYYDYTATPADIQQRLVSELGFSSEDAWYCIGKVTSDLLDGSYYNWAERVEYYVTYELQDYYIEYTWCYTCEEVYGVHETCPICGSMRTQTGQLAFGYTRDEVVRKLKNEGFSDSDIQIGLNNIPNDKFYDESIYKKP